MSIWDEIRISERGPRERLRKRPTHYCPICDNQLSLGTAHHCPSSVLAAINGADTRAWDEVEVSPDLYRKGGIGYRLAEAAAMITGEYE